MLSLPCYELYERAQQAAEMAEEKLVRREKSNEKDRVRRAKKYR